MKRFWHLSHIKQRREYYAGGLVVCDDSVETVRFAGGYFDSKLNPNYYITDYQGNNVAVADGSGLRKQSVWYYPYGEPLRRPSATFSLSSDNRYLFGDKEYSNFNGESQFDFGPRTLAPPAIPYLQKHDLHCENTPQLSPFIYCGGNPVMAIDPTGCDTINVIRGKNKIWEKPVVIFAKGDDVINVTDGENTSTHIFSEGEYGNRVIALNLEIKKAESSYTFGIYHVSGCNDSATGFYVTPGGEASNKKKSQREEP